MEKAPLLLGRAMGRPYQCSRQPRGRTATVPSCSLFTSIRIYLTHILILRLTMSSPLSTYRVQLSPAFKLSDLEQIVNYLERLQIATVYAAPFFQAKEGSTHGYDVSDPFVINKEIGDLEGFRSISETLKRKGMAWLQDIVPNHMANHPTNPWCIACWNWEQALRTIGILTSIGTTKT